MSFTTTTPEARIPDPRDPSNAGDPEVLIEEARRRARRRRRAYAAVVAMFAIVGASAAVVMARSGPSSSTAAAPEVAAGAADAAPGAASAATGVPWCVPDPDNPGAELIVGAGADIQVKCGFPSWLLYQAGTTILVGGGDVLRVADGELTDMGGPGVGATDVMTSHDGRLVAWLSTSYGALGSNCGGSFRLTVFEVATATQTTSATLDLPESGCFGLAGIDDLGRVYVTTSPGDVPRTDVYMFDPGSGTWTKVTDLHGAQITYITADGIAVAAETATYNGHDWAMASVEGVVEADGRFVAQRQVPVGGGLWSPDRSMVVELRPDVVLVRPADDLDRPVTLDVPGTPHRPLDMGMQWTPDGLVLISAGSGPGLNPATYQCDPQSGACSLVSTVGHPAYEPLSSKPG